VYVCALGKRNRRWSWGTLLSPVNVFRLITRIQQYCVIILGGLSGRLDQTISTLSYLHKLRLTRTSVFAVTDDNVGWVLDAVSALAFDHEGISPLATG
jgi:thiamine pyrophosphokinase